MDFAKRPTKRSLSKRSILFVTFCVLVCVIPYLRQHSLSLNEDIFRRVIFFGPPIFCKDRLIYTHKLPSIYNTELLNACYENVNAPSFCSFLENGGLGREALPLSANGSSLTGWYHTWDFALEVYFYERLKRYPCRTENPDSAAAFYVPFFPTLAMLLHGEDQAKSLFRTLAFELQSQPFYTRHSGADHFLVLSRSTEVFKSTMHQMLNQPGFEHMIKVSPERAAPGSRAGRQTKAEVTEIAVPFLSYFHPTTLAELEVQQAWAARTTQRKLLASMAAATRRSHRASLRRFLTQQCERSQHCAMLHCVGPADAALHMPGFGPKHLNAYGDCSAHNATLPLFHSSHFCLQPPGDSFTRRSTFDALLAGCIPVFFHGSSAASQYFWHVPPKLNDWSVSLSDQSLGSSSLIDLLSAISERQRAVLRHNIVRYLPRLMYAVPWKRYPRQGYAKLRSANGSNRSRSGSGKRDAGGHSEGVDGKNVWRRDGSVTRTLSEFELLNQADAFDVALHAVIKTMLNNSMEGHAKGKLFDTVSIQVGANN